MVRIAWGLVDGTLGAGVDEAFDARVEVVQGHQGVDVAIGVAHGGRLEGIEQGTLALGQVLAGGADLADRFKDLLQQGELVRRERVAGDEFGGVLVAFHGHRVADEGQLVVDDVALLFETVAQGHVCGFGLG